MLKIGVSSSKKAGAKGRDNEGNSSGKHQSKRGGGVGLGLGKRTARVAPAHTVFVAAAADSHLFSEGKKRSSSGGDPAPVGRMALNGNLQQQTMMDVDAELSPENNSKLWVTCS